MYAPALTGPAHKVAIYRSSSIGDVILGTACLDLLSQIPGQIEITWIGREPSLDVIRKAWPQVRAIEVKKSLTIPDVDRLVKEIGALHLIVDLQANLRSKWVCHMLSRETGATLISMDKNQVARNHLLMAARFRGRRRPLPPQSRTASRLQHQMMTDALKIGLCKNLADGLKDYVRSAIPVPRLPIADHEPANPWERELKFGRWLAIAPGAAHATKQAPEEIFAGILDQFRSQWQQDTQSKSGILPKQSLAGLALLGDEKDRRSAIAILDRIGWQGPVLNLTGKLTLWETTRVLSNCHALLTNDSALGHISEAVNTPVAVLFGPTIEAFGFPPRLKQSRAFSASLGCRPCSKHGRTACRFGDQLCFASIAMGEVADHLYKLVSPAESFPPTPGPSAHQLIAEITNG